jgi:hypothetical protein
VSDLERYDDAMTKAFAKRREGQAAYSDAERIEYEILRELGIVYNQRESRWTRDGKTFHETPRGTLE